MNLFSLHQLGLEVHIFRPRPQGFFFLRVAQPRPPVAPGPLKQSESLPHEDGVWDRVSVPTAHPANPEVMPRSWNPGFCNIPWFKRLDTAISSKSPMCLSGMLFSRHIIPKGCSATSGVERTNSLLIGVKLSQPEPGPYDNPCPHLVDLPCQDAMVGKPQEAPEPRLQKCLCLVRTQAGSTSNVPNSKQSPQMTSTSTQLSSDQE